MSNQTDIRVERLQVSKGIWIQVYKINKDEFFWDHVDPMGYYIASPAPGFFHSMHLAVANAREYFFNRVSSPK